MNTTSSGNDAASARSEGSRSETSAIDGLDAVEGAGTQGWWQNQLTASAGIYWAIHAGCLMAIWTPATNLEIALCLALFWIRMFGITAGYHRHFAHKSFKTSRALQFVLAILGAASVQKGPLWWAAGHRRHHRYSDQLGDLHSPREGFYRAHQGWIFDVRWNQTEIDRIRDFARYPELVWLNRWHIAPPLALAVGCQGFFWWEIDITYYALRGLRALGLVWDLREPPSEILRPNKSAAKLPIAA